LGNHPENVPLTGKGSADEFGRVMQKVPCDSSHQKFFGKKFLGSKQMLPFFEM
jgi:hypothetical protein